MASLLLAPLLAAVVPAAPLPPPDQQKLARDIYKELVEIDTSYSTGATTPAAEAMAARLKAAGFPEADVHVVWDRPRRRTSWPATAAFLHDLVKRLSH